MWNAIFSGIIGVIVGVVLQPPLTKVWEVFLKWFKRHVLNSYARTKQIDAGGDFVYGNRVTSVFVVDGDGHRSFEKENVAVDVQKKEIASCAEFDYFYHQTKQELARKNSLGELVPWDGKTLSLYSYQVQRTADVEEYVLHLTLLYNNYYKTYAAIHHLNEICPISNKTMMDYIRSFSFGQSGTYLLPNSMGICLQVITADGYTIFSKRAEESGFRSGETDVSIVEGLNTEQDIVNRSVDFKMVATRAFAEEICEVPEDELEINLLGLIFDKKYNQWNMVGIAEAKTMKRETIIRQRNSGSSGKWELTIDFVKMNLEEIMLYISSRKMWDTGLVTLYFALVNYGYSKRDINKAILKYESKKPALR